MNGAEICIFYPGNSKLVSDCADPTVLEGPMASPGYKKYLQFDGYLRLRRTLLVHRGVPLRELPALRIRACGRRLIRAGMGIAHTHRLAARNRPLLTLALEGVFDIHSRVSALEAKLHLRAGMVAVDRNLLDLAIHRRKIQIRSPVQVLLDTGADGVLIVHLLRARGRK